MRLLFSPESYNLGETTRGIEVAHAAAKRGHDVLFHVYAERYLDLITESGHAVTRAEPQMSQAQADQIMALDQGRSLRHPFSEGIVRRRVQSEIRALKGVDAVVIGSNPTMYLSARIARVPLFFVRPYFISRSHLMKVGDGHRAPRALRLASHVVSFKPASFRTVAAEFGLALPRRTVELLSGDTDLVASLFPAIDGRQMASRDIAVGPIHYRPNATLPSALTSERRGRPLVYVGMGSSGSPTVLARILRQLADQPLDVVVAGGVRLPATVTSSLGENIHLAGMVPEHRLRGRIDAAITHGGEGTVQAICRAGVPFAGYPMQAEQRWNITECVRHGNALRLRSSDVRRGRIPRIIKTLLTDSSLRSSAAALAQRMDGIDGPLAAVRAIERIASE